MRLTAPNYDVLIEAGISPSLAQVISKPSEADPELSIIIQESEWDYPIPYGVTSVVPIYGHNADMTVRWHRDGRLEFAAVHHDGDDWHVVATSEQGLMAHILFGYCEMAMCTDEEHGQNLPNWQRIARMMGFRYEDEFWEWAEQPDTGNSDWNQWIIDLK